METHHENHYEILSSAAPLQALRLWQQRRPCQARQVFQGLRPKNGVWKGKIPRNPWVLNEKIIDKLWFEWEDHPINHR